MCPTRGRGWWARSHFADEQTAGRALGLSGLWGLGLGAEAEPRLSGVGGRLVGARPRLCPEARLAGPGRTGPRAGGRVATAPPGGPRSPSVQRASPRARGGG